MPKAAAAAAAFEADVTREASMKPMIDAARQMGPHRHLHSNVVFTSLAATAAARDHRGGLRPHNDGPFARRW